MGVGAAVLNWSWCCFSASSGVSGFCRGVSVVDVPLIIDRHYEGFVFKGWIFLDGGGGGGINKLHELRS